MNKLVVTSLAPNSFLTSDIAYSVGYGEEDIRTDEQRIWKGLLGDGEYTLPAGMPVRVEDDMLLITQGNVLVDIVCLEADEYKAL